MSGIPLLESERLRLRAPESNDLEACAAMWADPLLMRFISGKPSTREESWRRLLAMRGHWAVLGFGYWLIEEKASGAFAGIGGFGSYKRDLGAHDLEAPEQGWSLAASMQGKGYAGEALRTMLAWAEPYFRRTDFVCLVHPDNAASLRLAAKVGYVEYARLLYQGEPGVLMRRP